MDQKYLNVIGFRPDNTIGYDTEQLKQFNDQLATRVADYEPFSDEWYEAAKIFADEIARR